MSNYITLKFAYENTDFTRTYQLSDVPTSALSSVKSKVQSINNTLASSSATTERMQLKANFVADSYDATHSYGTGHMAAISEVTIVQEDVTKIPLF